MPPQLEKNHVVPTAWQDEALARDGVSREVPCSALMKVKSESEVDESCQTLSDPMDYSPPGSFVHGIFQARVLECWLGK